jgi:hypothetical protein
MMMPTQVRYFDEDDEDGAAGAKKCGQCKKEVLATQSHVAIPHPEIPGDILVFHNEGKRPCWSIFNQNRYPQLPVIPCIAER